MTTPRSVLFGGILAAYLIIGSLYAILTPPWQAPDEPAHYNYVRYLAHEASFPELVSRCYNQAYLNQLTTRRFPPDLSLDTVCYEFHQPPLYYLLATPIFILTDGSLLGLRLLSVLLGGGVVVLAFCMGRLIFPQQAMIGYGTMAFVAFVPMHIAILAAVNNDALAELLLAALLLLLCRRLRAVAPPSLHHDLLLGGLLGLGLLTKVTVYIALPLVAVSLGLSQPKKRQLLGQGVIIYGLALLLALPWYMRNIALYGNFDILGLARHNQVVVGQLRTATLLADVGWITYASNFVTTTFHSFWGQFGWMAVPMDGRTYLVLTMLTFVALSGLGKWGGDFLFQPGLTPAQRRMLGLMALTVILMALGYGWYNLTFVQFQGRYLFPALIPMGLFFTLGLHAALSPRWSWGLAGGLALVLIGLIITAIRHDDLDKWQLLLVGLTLSLAVGRARLLPSKSVPVAWLLTLCYGGLTLLALLTPFWFVIPYLSP